MNILREIDYNFKFCSRPPASLTTTKPRATTLLRSGCAKFLRIMELGIRFVPCLLLLQNENLVYVVFTELMYRVRMFNLKKSELISLVPMVSNQCCFISSRGRSLRRRTLQDLIVRPPTVTLRRSSLLGLS